jgi:hypothetical protein
MGEAATDSNLTPPEWQSEMLSPKITNAVLSYLGCATIKCNLLMH